MSRFGLNQRGLSARTGSLRKKMKGLFGLDKSRSQHRKLRIDRLEERQLLSVTPAASVTPSDIQDMLVTDGQMPYYSSQTIPDPNPAHPGAVPEFEIIPGSVLTNLRDYPGSANTSDFAAAHSMATDNQGDFVVTWTQNDLLYQVQRGANGYVLRDAYGNPIYAQVVENGAGKTDANIYARYFTDEVQRVILPVGTDNFQVTLGGQSVQQISISSSPQPGVATQPNIIGTIQLKFNNRVFPWSYNETKSVEANRAALQDTVHMLGGTATDATVTASGSHDFLIHFGSAAGGQAQPLIVVDPTSTVWTSGFVPAAVVSEVWDPTVTIGSGSLGPIKVNADPATTARTIQNWFSAQTQATTVVGPAMDNPGSFGPQTQPETYVSPVPNVTVRAVLGLTDSNGASLDGRVFDITFGGRPNEAPGADPKLSDVAGKHVFPQVVLTSVKDASGATLQPAADAVTITKQSSPIFRVNPQEFDKPETTFVDFFDQSHSAVAMDSDGDFVITWQTEVSDNDIFRSFTDIYAERFAPLGIVSDPSSVRGILVDRSVNWTDGQTHYIQGVRAIVNDVQTLTFTAPDANRVSGSYRLQLGPVTTNAIAFDSFTPQANADAITTALTSAGYDGVQTTVNSSANPYSFTITFGGLSGGIDVPAIVFVRDPGSQDATPLPNNVTVTPADVAGGQSAFRVNTNTADPQFDPDIGMDAAGNFTIAWGTASQDASWFARIWMQRFDRRGQRLGGEIAVSPNTTEWDYHPFVGVSPDGSETIITWTHTYTRAYLTAGPDAIGPFTHYIEMALYDPAFDASYQRPRVGPMMVLDRTFDNAGNALAGYAKKLEVDFTGDYSTVGFDGNNNFIITVAGQQFVQDLSNNNSRGSLDMDGTGRTSKSILALELPANFSGDFGAQHLNSGFWRVNSTLGFDELNWLDDYRNSPVNNDFEIPEPTRWDGNQDFGQVGFDAHGNVFIGYQGFGPAVTDGINWTNADDAAAVLQKLLSLPDYKDAKQYLQTYGMPLGNQNNGQPDGVIDEVLISAANQGASNAALGQLRAVLEQVVGLMRGESSGMLFSRYDVNPGASQGILATDAVANAERDGRDARYLISVSAAAGAFTLNVSIPSQGLNAFVTTSALTLQADLNALFEQFETTNGFVAPGMGIAPLWSSIARVRPLSAAEINSRTPTPWDITSLISAGSTVYEVTFQGEAANMPVGLSLAFPAPGVRVSVLDGGSRGTQQVNPSLRVLPDGGFVTSWYQGDLRTDGTAAVTNIYARRFQERHDRIGPQVTDLVDTAGRLLDNGDSIQSPVNTIIVAFDEEMMAAGADSVTNPSNWQLLKNGVALNGAIINVQFGMNRGTDWAAAHGVKWNPTNKWEAVITFDGDPVKTGNQDLAPAVYTIQAFGPNQPNGVTRSGLRDISGNPLGSSGYNPLGAAVVSRTFRVVPSTATGPAGQDSAVTSTPTNPHTYAESRKTIAAAADGRYVVVWTATNASTGHLSVYYRLFNGDGTAADMVLVNAAGQPVDLTGQLIPPGGTPVVIKNAAPVMALTGQFADFSADDQRDASVASDPDGDFVVTWTNSRSGEQDVYMREFNAMGGLLGVAYDQNNNLVPVVDPAASAPVMANTSYSQGDQKWSTAAMDAHGDAVVVWTSAAEDGSGYGVFAQRFNFQGQAVGPEIPVNFTTAGNQYLPSVAMGADGRFVVTWTGDNAAGTDTDIFVRGFDPNGNPTSQNDIPVNTTTAGNQIYSDVATDLSGDNFVVTWSSAGQDGDGYGVFARRFTNVGGNIAANGGEIQVNTTTNGNQMYSGVAMSHQGDFIITWSGRGEQPGQRDTSGFGGVYIQRYQASGAVDGGETRLNNTIDGNQYLSSISSDGQGNYVADWTGVDPTDVTRTRTTVFSFASATTLPVADLDGPIVDHVTLPNGTVVNPNDTIQPPGGVQKLKVIVDTDLSQVNATSGVDSVTNPANWLLAINGVTQPNMISSIMFQFNPLTRKYEATVTFDGNGVDPGAPPLPAGSYVLTMRDSITDGANRLDGNYDGVTGSGGGSAGYAFPFVVAASSTDNSVYGAPGTANARTYVQARRAVAADVAGDYVVAWTASNGTHDRVYFRLFGADGAPLGNVNSVTAPSASSHDQRYANVAMDADGDFVITWTDYTGTDPTGSGDGEVYAQRFDSTGAPIGPSQGAAFRVNTNTTNGQRWSTVASDVHGDFVVAWSSYGQENNAQLGSGWGIYAQRYDSFGRTSGPEFPVNTTTPGNQMYPSAAMDAQGRFVITWTGANSKDNVYARVFNADGSSLSGPTSGEILVSGALTGAQHYSDVAMDLAGNNFAVTWTGAEQGGTDYDVYARTYTRNAGANPPAFVASTNAFVVSQTTAGAQAYSSVAMNHQGAFAVTWSGNGTQTNQQDDSGVFYRRFTAAGVASGGEIRVNKTTAGTQWMPSASSDGAGNLVFVWCGGTPTSDVYSYPTRPDGAVSDRDGPIVTDVLLATGTRVMPNDQLNGPLTSLTVLFGEKLNTASMTAAASVTNPANWKLTRNGLEVIGGISGINPQRNPTTRKYEATVQFSPALTGGQYVLTARSSIMDTASNKLDGDYDGVTGTVNAEGYVFPFTIGSQVVGTGDEFLVNAPDVNGLPDQTNAIAVSTGNAQEQSNRTVAVDHDGDFVAVWIEQGATQTVVKARVFDRNNTALNTALNTPPNGEITVAASAGAQKDPTVAIDADGDFIVAWAQQDGTGTTSDWNVYARRYSSMGVALAAPFMVNSTPQYDQVKPSVAVTDQGQFVVVWSQTGTNYGYFNDIRGQVFDYTGQKIGTEFQASTPVAGLNTVAGQSQSNPSVAISGATGNFVVAWDQVTAQTARRVTDTQVWARLYNANGTFQGAAFRADNGPGTGGSDIARTARNPQVAMNDNGSFVLVYESFDAATSTYDVEYRGFDATGNPLAGGQVNTARLAGQQVNPSVAVDGNGGFFVAFNGAGAQPDPLNPNNPAYDILSDQEGVFFQQYDAQFNPVDVQQRVNRTDGGIQQFASVGVTRDGDPLFVWSGRGAGDRQGIFARRFDKGFDNVGPMVSDLVTSHHTSIPNGGQVSESISYLVVTFDEQMFNTAQGTVGWANSVSNPTNYTLTYSTASGQQTLLGAIGTIVFGLNQGSQSGPLFSSFPLTNKWEAVVAIDGNGNAPGAPFLSGGHYQLIMSSRLRDLGNNPLNSTVANPNGSDTTWTFDVGQAGQPETPVNTNPAGNQSTQSPQSVAGDPNGDYVIVWTSTAVGGVGNTGIYAKMYRATNTNDTVNGRQSSTSVVKVNIWANGQDTGQEWLNDEIQVTSDPTATRAAVARNGDGDFVVTWEQQDKDANGQKTDWNIYARRYTAAGMPMDMGAGPFRVNARLDSPQLKYSVQKNPAVAMDVEGDFVITYQSLGQDGGGYGIYAQRYSPAGNPLGGVNEIQAIDLPRNATGTFTLAWDANGNGVISSNEMTSPIAYTGTAYAVAGAVQNALAGIGAQTSVIAVSQTQLVVEFVGVSGSVNQPPIAVVASTLTGGSSGNTITVTTKADGKSGEFLVNDTTAGNQTNPSIAMNATGDFVISWTGEVQPVAPATQVQTDIFAKQFVSNKWIAGANLFAADPRSVRHEGDMRVVTTDDPNNHIISTGTGYDGVVQVNLAGAFNGSGSLLWTGHHILTAAHVVWDFAANIPYLPGQLSVTFWMPTTGGGSTPVTVNVSAVNVNPGWNPNGFGGDIAVLTLASDPPATAQRYNISRSTDEIGKLWSLYGYGNFGIGAETTNADNQKRIGHNVYEMTGDQLGPAAGLTSDLLVYDFVDPANPTTTDFFLTNFGRQTKPLMSQQDGNSAHGDSGGPIFISGLVAAIVTGGGAPTAFNPNWVNTDDDANAFNSSYGEFSYDTRVSVYADWIDAVIQSVKPEFRVNTTIAGSQDFSSVAMDLKGDFTVAWTSYGQDSPGSPNGGANGVYAQRYDSTAAKAGGEFKVNSFVDGNQQRPSVSMDADGDFTVTWESFQDGNGAPTSYGIYAQRYASNALLGTSPFIGPNGELAGEFRVNTTADGDQRYPSVAMSHAEDLVIVWSGNGAGDNQGVFYARTRSGADDAGPIVANVLNVVGTGSGTTYAPVRDGSVLGGTVTKFLLTMGENLDQTGGVNGVHSITNPTNWRLTLNGGQINGGVSPVSFVFNAKTQKYEATVIFDSDPTKPGAQALGPGDYVLTVRQNVQDLFGNALDGNYDGIPGGDFQRKFTIIAGAGGGGGGSGGTTPGNPSGGDDERVNNDQNGAQDQPAIACDAAGNYIVVWATSDTVSPSDIMAQRYASNGQKIGPQFMVNSVTAGNQTAPDVAMDPSGNFVVVWSGPGQQGTGASAITDADGVWAQMYDADGLKLGGQMIVNSTTDGNQWQPSVAIDDSDNFVVAWRDDNLNAIRYRGFSSAGTQRFPEQTANSAYPGAQDMPSVAMDRHGDFVIVWESSGQDGDGLGIFGQRFNLSGGKVGVIEFPVNSTPGGMQSAPRVAMDATGDFAVVWQSLDQDGSGYGIYTKRYNAQGGVTKAETRVNQTTLYWQLQPAISMDNVGDTVITWTSQNQDGDGDGVYARMYNADASDFVSPTTGQAPGEFRINARTAGDQNSSDVAMDADGDFTAVWAGPDANQTGVYQRRVRIHADSASSLGGATVRSFGGAVGWSGGWTADPSLDGPTSTALTGTSSTDVFVVNLSTAQVTLNGVLQPMDYRTTFLTIDGQGGTNRVVFTGRAGTETAEIWPDHMVVTSGTLTVAAANVQGFTYSGNGTDTVTLHGSTLGDQVDLNTGSGKPFASVTWGASQGSASLNNFWALTTFSTGNAADVVTFRDSAPGATKDNLIVYPRQTVMAGPGYYFSEAFFPTVQAFSAGGGTSTDQAKFYDEAADVTFTAGPTSAVLVSTIKGVTYTTTANQFSQNLATMTHGGNDVAVLNGANTTTQEKFNAYPTYGVMTGSGFYNSATGFKSVTANSNGGVNDSAQMYDSAGNDTVVADPTKTTFTYASGVTATAKGFAMAYAVSSQGGKDTATAYADGNQNFFSRAALATSGTLASLSGTTGGANFFDQIVGFNTIEAISRNGVNTASIYDGAGDQIAYLTPTSAQVTDAAGSFSEKATGFRYAAAFAAYGGNDRAIFLATGDDIFNSGYDKGRLWAKMNTLTGAAYDVSANLFPLVRAYGQGGTDSAYIYGTPTAKNELTAYPTSVSLVGGGFSTVVAGFSKVNAYSQNALDVAHMYDSDGNDTFAGTPTLGFMSGATAAGQNYANRAFNFPNVDAHAINGGVDSATFYDSALADVIAADNLGVTLSHQTIDAVAKFQVQALGFKGNGTKKGTIVAKSQNKTDQVTGDTGVYDYIFQLQKSW